MRPGLFFEGVEAAELEAALAGAERRLLPKGSLVVSEGDYLDEMYVVGGRLGGCRRHYEQRSKRDRGAGPAG
jgi:hypothetical protein